MTKKEIAELIQQTKAEFLNEEVVKELDLETIQKQSYAKGWNDCNRHWIRTLNEYTDKPNNTDKSEDKEDCYKAYDRIASYIFDSSKKVDIDLFKVVVCLARNDHAPSAMASLLANGKINFDDATSYIDEAINELKEGVNNG